MFWQLLPAADTNNSLTPPPLSPSGGTVMVKSATLGHLSFLNATNHRSHNTFHSFPTFFLSIQMLNRHTKKESSPRITQH